MRSVITNWQPQNTITTPLIGTPSYINSGIIKAVTKGKDKISIAQIDYQEFDEENFQYIISPYWEIIDGLPASIFQGIPGIDMELRLNRYYRVNYIPTFIAERTPSKGREDLWELMESVGLDYYDRFEWLLRTKLRSANDNLIVERRRQDSIIETDSIKSIYNLQYGDKIIVDSIDSIAETTAGFLDVIFHAATNGIDMMTRDGQILIGQTARESMVPLLIAQRMIRYREHMSNRQKGINEAKQEGKYSGRKPINVDENLLFHLSKELETGMITVEEAMKRAHINSRSTFYRKLRKLRQ